MSPPDRSVTRLYSVITGSGSHLPVRVVSNEDYLQHAFYGPDGTRLAASNEEIIRKFAAITGILERRHVTNDQVASDIASLAAAEALADAQMEGEALDQIILAHNFGDIREDNRRSDAVPALASRVKHRLGIRNPRTLAYDVCCGCAGWLQGMIQADLLVRSGGARRVLVIGAETLSRVADPHDRDSMIYADGAGAVVVEARESPVPVGVLAHASRTDALEEAYVLRLGDSNRPDYPGRPLFLKMQGRSLYEHALKVVPPLLQEAVVAAGLTVGNLDKLLLHQANTKMVEAIVRRLYEASGLSSVPEGVLPLTLARLGNSSVATLPTLFDLLRRGRVPGHTLPAGAVIALAAMGAGVHCSAMAYRLPG